MAAIRPTWPEVASVKNENRYELVLSGAAISKRLEESELDPALYQLQGLNYLNISETCLSNISADLGKMKNLTNLVLHSNQLSSLPSSIGELTKLKMLDVSRNSLEEIPVEIQNLSQLSSLNLASNKLSSFPSMKENSKLSLLDLSLNQFEDFPDICHPELIHLAEVKLQGNQIKDIPPNIATLVSLKLLDLSENAITIVPGQLADCIKLKDINMKGNKLKDNRLRKLVDQCRPKQVLDYVKQNCPKVGPAGAVAAPSGGSSKKGKKGKQKQPEPEIEEVVAKLTHKMKILHVSESVPQVMAHEDSIKAVRPHIVCCVIRNVNFTLNLLRHFIQLQTRLHDTTCARRHLATIATHDLALIPAGTLQYVALPPSKLKLVPLGQDKAMTAPQLLKNLQAEVEEDRKSAHSGIHKYVGLLEGKVAFPCLRDSQKRVISFPPITNSDATKISEATKDIFVEVTSSQSQGACKTVLDELLAETLALGLGDPEDNSDVNLHSLVVEQVKVVNPEGLLKVVYPSRADLQLPEASNITVIRD